MCIRGAGLERLAMSKNKKSPARNGSLINATWIKRSRRRRIRDDYNGEVLRLLNENNY